MKKVIERVEFTKEMKKSYKILFPNMIDIHFKILRNVMESYGYDIDLLTNTDQGVIEDGLKYVHNDTCYPALLTIGQMISALKSGRYDLDHTALMMSQTGGGCRASNYIFLLRKALINAGMGQIPVISVNLSGLEKNSGFKMTLPLIQRMLAAMTYGDLLMLLSNQTRPYEIEKGQTDALIETWITNVSQRFIDQKAYALKPMRKFLKEIVDDFSAIAIQRTQKVKVGIVGEIYVKYAALGNNNLEKFLASQDCEVMVPGILGFLLFKVDNRIEDIALYGGNRFKKIFAKILFDYLMKYEIAISCALKDSPQFIVPSGYHHLKALAQPIIGSGCKMGEGWCLTAEMMELAQLGYENIVCTQPFGCLPNHIVGKGMIRKIKTVFPEANIVPIDYDPGATKVNQENRIKLMLAVAKEQLSGETLDELLNIKNG
jgi:predicted nucleotide-binding protein (sugar kinase/HSP70/actin superfamily)